MGPVSDLGPKCPGFDSPHGRTVQEGNSTVGEKG